jgi:hypothetical protein
MAEHGTCLRDCVPFYGSFIAACAFGTTEKKPKMSRMSIQLVKCVVSRRVGGERGWKSSDGFGSTLRELKMVRTAGGADQAMLRPRWMTFIDLIRSAYGCSDK